jgi:uncharacterized protein (TIGR03545 family)
MFRWKGIIFIAVVAAIIVTISLLLTDRWLENKLESSGSAIVGAKVEIDGLDFSIFGARMKWQRIQVTDPKNTWKNIFETGVSDFNLEFWPLLSKKFIVENFQVSGFRTYTDRKTDGAIPKPPKEEKSEPGFISKTITNLSDKASGAAQTQFTSYKQKVNVDSIMALLNIQSVKKIDSLKNDLTGKYAAWDQRFNQWNVEQSVQDIETKVKSLDVNKIKTVEQAQTALTTVEDVRKSAEKLTGEAQSIKKDLLGDLNTAKSALAQADDWIKADYDHARSLAKLPDLSAQNIGSMVFGPGLVNQVNQYLGYVETARGYAAKLKSDKPAKEEKPPRMKGQDIYFYNPNARPDFWIKQIQLSGETNDGLQLEGSVQHIVSDQRLINRPTEFRIYAGKETASKLELSGVFNYLGAEPLEQFKASYTGFSMANTKLSDSPFLPNKITKGSGAVYASLNLAGESLNSEVKFIASALEFDFGATSKNYFEKIVQDIVRKISIIDLIAKIEGSKGDARVSINSNLDDLFMNSLKSIFSAEVEKAKKMIQERIDKEVSKYRAELDKIVKEKEAQLNARLKNYEDQVNEKLAMIEAKKKEVEKKIEDEKNKLGKDAEKQLKKLFK